MTNQHMDKGGKLRTPLTFYQTDSEGIFTKSINVFSPGAVGIKTAPPADRLLPKQVYSWQGDFTSGHWKKVFDLREGGAFNIKDGTPAATMGIFDILPTGLTTEDPQGKTIFNIQTGQWEDDPADLLKQAKEKKKQALKIETDELLATGKTIDIGGKQRRFQALQEHIYCLTMLLVRLGDGETSKFENYNPQGEEDNMTGKSQSLSDDWYPEHAFTKSELQTILGTLEAYYLEKKEAQHNAYRLVETASTIDAVNQITL